MSRILLVDDSEFDREKFMRALKADPNARYEFQELEEGENLERVAMDWLPHLVVLDFSLPAFNGLALLKQLVEKHGKLTVPVVMVSGRGDEATAVAAMKLGALDYVVKDGLSSAEIRHVVRRALQKSALELFLIDQQKLLAESQRRLELALGVSGLGIWEWDIKSDRLYWSPETEVIMGYSPGNSGRTYDDFFKSIYVDDRDEVLEKIQQAIQHKAHYRHEFRICRQDGNIRWVSTGVKADYGTSGEPILLRGTLADVTEKKQIQIELQIALDQLKEEQGLREKFVAILLHDLRNPLAAAKILIERMLRFPQRAEMLEQEAPNALASLERADRMIQGLLDTSSLRAGKSLPV